MTVKTKTHIYNLGKFYCGLDCGASHHVKKATAIKELAGPNAHLLCRSCVRNANLPTKRKKCKIDIPAEELAHDVPLRCLVHAGPSFLEDGLDELQAQGHFIPGRPKPEAQEDSYTFRCDIDFPDGLRTNGCPACGCDKEPGHWSCMSVECRTAYNLYAAERQILRLEQKLNAERALLRHQERERYSGAQVAKGDPDSIVISALVAPSIQGVVDGILTFYTTQIDRINKSLLDPGVVAVDVPGRHIKRRELEETVRHFRFLQKIINRELRAPKDKKGKT